jgi:hypothetical protein
MQNAMAHPLRQPGGAARLPRVNRHFDCDLSRRKLFDAGLLHSGKRVPNDHPVNFPARRDFGKRHKHKSALE